MRMILTSLWLTSLICLASGAWAQDKELDALLKVDAQYRPITDEDVASLKNDLTTKLNELDAYLYTLGGDARAKWRKDLLLDPVAESLAGDVIDLPGMAAASKQLAQNLEGLEAPAFLDFRSALRKYDRALRIQGNPKSAELFGKQIAGLRASMKKYAAEPTVESGSIIGSVLGNLELGGQGDTLVTAARGYFRRPNLNARISQRLAAAGMSQEINESQDVSEVILGTTNNGVATMVGGADVTFIPNNDNAQFEIVMNGVAYSSTVGVNRGVTIRSRGATNLNGGTTILLDPTGVSGTPAWATAATSTTVDSIYHKCKIIRRVAQQQVAQKKGQAERIAAQRAANRLAARLNNERDETVDRLNGDFRSKFRYPLLRKGSFPSLLKATTTAEALSIVMTQGNAFQLAAASAPPKLEGELDLGVQLHESFVGNMSQAMIGGETLTSEKLAETLKEMTGKVPEGLAGEDEPDWSITFSNNPPPVQVKFEDQLIHLKIRGRRFTRGDSVVNSEMEIAATYKLERTDKGTRLLRQGEVTAEYTKGGFQNTEKIAIKTVMRKKFTALLQEERTFDGLELPGRWESAGKLPLKQLVCGKRWLVLGWTLPEAPVQNVTQSAEVDSSDAAE